MIKINYYKTNIGIFLDRTSFGYYAALDAYKINGEPAQDLVDGDKQARWAFLKDVHSIDSVDVEVAAKQIKIGYELKIASLESTEIPAKLLLETVEESYNSDNEEYVWKSYSDYQSLYKPMYETTPESWKPLEYELCLLREIRVDNYEAPQKMSVMLTESGTFKNYQSTCDLSGVVTYADIERMLTPEFLLHERPCSLSSQQVYKIVRNHIKSNIVSICAEITSDYDFCFTVRRKVALKPYVRKTEQMKNNGKSYHPPRFSTKNIAHSSEELFEMTDNVHRYNKYSVIQGWEADSLLAMKEQMECYLAELMSEINKPVVQCSHCNGTGHVTGDKIGTNTRENL